MASNTKSSKSEKAIQDRCNDKKAALNKIVYFPQDDSTECPPNYELETVSQVPNAQGEFITISYCCALYEE